MGWLSNRLRRGLTNRSHHRICQEVGSAGGGSALFAVAIAEAVYPDAIYGSEEWDGFRSLIPRKPVVDRRVAAQISAEWLDRGEMPWAACVARIYGCDADELLSDGKTVPATTSHSSSAAVANNVAEELRREIDVRVSAADQRVSMLLRVLAEPTTSEIEHERIVELGTRSIRCAYIALAGVDIYDAFENAFYAYAALMHADLLYKLDGKDGQQFDAEFLVQNHDRAYHRTRECDSILAEEIGQTAIRSSNEFVNGLKEDDPLRTLANWLSLALNGRFLT